MLFSVVLSASFQGLCGSHVHPTPSVVKCKKLNFSVNNLSRMTTSYKLLISQAAEYRSQLFS